MNKNFSDVYSVWESWIVPKIEQFQDNKYLSAVHQTFYILLPFWLTVSFFDILGNVFFDPQGIILGNDGLNLGMIFTGGLTGEEYLQSKFSQLFLVYKKTIDVAYRITSLILVMALSRQLAMIWNSDKVLTIFSSLAAFTLISSPIMHSSAENQDYFAGMGFFSAFLSTFLSARIFSWLYNIKKLRVKIPRSMPKELKYYLSPVFSVLLTMLIFANLAVAIVFLKLATEDFFVEIFRSTIFQNIAFVLLYQFVVWFLWWLGIPGYGVTAKLQEIAYTPLQISNQFGDTVAIFTTGFFEAGVIHVLGLIIAILVFSQHETWRKVAKFSVPLLLVNVQEVFIFGLPVVLNPIFLIPYILAPLANCLVGYFAISCGIVPIFQVDLPWTMPLFFSVAISTHSIMGGILQLVWLIMDIFIYAPFVITANTLEFNKEKKDGEEF